MIFETLKSRRLPISEPMNQIKLLETLKLPKFKDKLREIGLYPFKSSKIEVFQINLGKKCNQLCMHCHVDAGPDRTEIMSRNILEDCIKAIMQTNIKTIDLTGGAPEMNPNFKWVIEKLSKLGKQVIVRSNLTILMHRDYVDLPKFFKKHNIQIISSLPCYTKENVDKQRGDGVYARSIQILKKLNSLGYGEKGSGLVLNLVYNPLGAYLPGSQESLELDYKRELSELFEIKFNNLFTMVNMPINRFLDFLMSTGSYEDYMELLVNSFNPAVVKNLMCRNTISVDWEGFLYDCDFNQMLGLKIGGMSPIHIKDFDLHQLSDRKIIVSQNCYGCTAGSGSSCQGSVTCRFD